MANRSPPSCRSRPAESESRVIPPIPPCERLHLFGMAPEGLRPRRVRRPEGLARDSGRQSHRWPATLPPYRSTGEPDDPAGRNSHVRGFLGRKPNHGDIKPVGTVFFVSRSIVGTDSLFVYAVTARHVLDKIGEAGGYQVFLRLNIRGQGATWVEAKLQEWAFHPDDSSVNVAVRKVDFDQSFDHKVYPIESMVGPEILQEHAIGIGDEVFLVGLFSQHYGTERNIPIVRVGNIAAMPEEKIISGNYILDAYLVEARSIGGISGSPVFVYPGPTRPINGVVRLMGGGSSFYLLGLMHGHWDGSASNLDLVVEDVAGRNQVNMGIAIVVPASKILETINQPRFRDAEILEEEEFRRLNSPVMDTALATFTSSTIEVRPPRTGDGLADVPPFHPIFVADVSAPPFQPIDSTSVDRSEELGDQDLDGQS